MSAERKQQFNPDSYCDCCSEAGKLEAELLKEIASLSGTLEEWRALVEHMQDPFKSYRKP